MPISTSGGASKSNVEIGLSMVLEDNISRGVDMMSSKMKKAEQAAKAAVNANLAAISQISGSAYNISSGVMNGILGAVKSGSEFIDTMTFVKAIAKDTGTSFKALENQALSLGASTMFSSQDIASGMKYMAMAGMSTKEIANNIKGAAYLAGATMHELAGKGGAADIMTNVMKMFKVDSSEESSQRVADVLTKGVTSANISLQDLAETIKYSGTIGVNMGATIEQMTAFAGVLGNAGIQASMAGTAIANTYRYLSKSIADEKFKGHKALLALGLDPASFSDANGQLIDIGEAMAKISVALQNSDMTDVEKLNSLVSILGVRGERGGTVMMKAFEDYRKLLHEINNNSAGASSKVMEERMSTLAGASEAFVSVWQNLMVTFARAIEPWLVPLLKGLTTIVESIRLILGTPLGGFIAGVFTIGAAFTMAGAAAFRMWSIMKLIGNDSLVTFRNILALVTGRFLGAAPGAAMASTPYLTTMVNGAPFRSPRAPGDMTPNQKFNNMPYYQKYDRKGNLSWYYTSSDRKVRNQALAGSFYAPGGKGANQTPLIQNPGAATAARGGAFGRILGGVFGVFGKLVPALFAISLLAPLLMWGFRSISSLFKKSNDEAQEHTNLLRALQDARTNSTTPVSQWDASTIAQLNESLQELKKAAKNLANTSFKGTVTLKDNNGNEVGSGELKSTEYGSDGK